MIRQFLEVICKREPNSIELKLPRKPKVWDIEEIICAAQLVVACASQS